MAKKKNKTTLAKVLDGRLAQVGDVVEFSLDDALTRAALAEDLKACRPEDEVWVIVHHADDWDLIGSLISTTELLTYDPVPVAYLLPNSPVSPRVQALCTAAEHIEGDRNVSYGTPTENFANIAAFWNVQFGHLLKKRARFMPGHVAQANALQKLARMIAQPKGDNWIDLAGYAACGYEVENPE